MIITIIFHYNFSIKSKQQRFLVLLYFIEVLNFICGSFSHNEFLIVALMYSTDVFVGEEAKKRKK